MWWGPDNNGQTTQSTGVPSEQTLTSPSMHVGTDPLSISFRHRFSFEAGAWDGGVLEISVNDGAWQPVAGPYNGTTNAVTNSPIGRNRAAFVNRIAGWPNFAAATFNLGTAFADQNVRIRFRVGADESVGAPGWDIDDIVIGGTTTTPFTAFVGQAVCPTQQNQ